VQQNKTLQSEGKRAAKYINWVLVGELMTDISHEEEEN